MGHLLMKPRLANAAIVAFLAGPAAAETVTLSIEQTTQPGQSVFVSAPHPMLGNGAVQSAVKLVPQEYPVWQATFDMPAGVAFTPEFLVRNDSPANLPNPANVISSQVGEPVSTTEPAGDVGQRFTIWTSAATETVTGRVFTSADDFTPVDVVFELVEEADDTRQFRAHVTPQDVAMGRRFEILIDDNPITPSGGLRLHGRDLEYRHSQFFRGPAPEQPPLPARRETFTWTPSDARFKPRTIRVQLPRNYDRDTTATYPVLYAQDGQNVFAPGGPFGSWDLDIITRNFATQGEIPDIILVGIDNTSDRLVEYIPSWLSLSGNSGRGEDFLAIIRDELMPEVQSRYRVATGPENTTHIGSSLGGVLGFVAAHEFPDLFGTVVAMSPSTWIDRAEFISRATSTDPASRARLWIDSGTAGSSNDSYADTIALRDAMIAAGHAIGPHLAHAVGLNHQHNEAAWRLRSPDALRWAYNAVAPEISEHSDVFVIWGEGE
jgi:predicted alpha/beta superfamily hydrolase